MSILEIQNLKKSFGNLNVLKGINFTLEKGDVLAIIGPSGNGKTTLLRCINFLETPNEGKIIVNGETIFDASQKEKLTDREIRERRLHFGMVFQNFNLFPQYTVFENVTLARKLIAEENPDFSVRKKEIYEDIDKDARELLEKVGLSDKLDFYPHQLSGGQQQRVAIARALCMKPDILCFDEPTSALDPLLTGEVLKVIKSLADSKMTMIVVTHEMGFARDVANKIIFMNDGQSAAEGDSRYIFEECQEPKLLDFLGKISELK